MFARPSARLFRERRKSLEQPNNVASLHGMFRHLFPAARRQRCHHPGGTAQFQRDENCAKLSADSGLFSDTGMDGVHGSSPKNECLATSLCQRVGRYRPPWYLPWQPVPHAGTNSTANRRHHPKCGRNRIEVAWLVHSYDNPLGSTVRNAHDFRDVTESLNEPTPTEDVHALINEDASESQSIIEKQHNLLGALNDSASQLSNMAATIKAVWQEMQIDNLTSLHNRNKAYPVDSGSPTCSM